MLDQLKTRLEALDGKRRRAGQANLFAEFQRKTTAARAQAAEAGEAARYAVEFGPAGADYADVFTQIKKAREQAEKLGDQLGKDAESITTDPVNGRFKAMFANTKKASDDCQRIWQRSIEDKLRGRAELAQVLAPIVPNAGPEFQTLVNKLTADSGQIPPTAEAAKRVAARLARFDELITQLRIDDPVGEFLKAAASGGAAAQKLLDPKVRQFIDEQKLWATFKVTLA